MENSAQGIPGAENIASLYEQIKDRIEIKSKMNILLMNLILTYSKTKTT